MEFTEAYLRASKDNPKDPGSIREFVISDEGIDRHGTIIKVDGWKWTNFLKNPVFQYAHSANRIPDPDLIIGKAVKIWKESTAQKKLLVSKAKFDVDGEADLNNALAKKALYKYDNGYLNTTSVGFDPITYGWGEKENKEKKDVWYYRTQDLLEYSAAPVPSNPRATMRSLEEWRNFIDKEGLKGEDLMKLIKGELPGSPLLAFLDVPEKDIIVPAVKNYYYQKQIRKSRAVSPINNLNNG